MRREESSIFSTCLLMFVFTNCSEIQTKKLCSSSCGDIKNISYPFRLKSDPSGCGYPEFQLSCESNRTILELNPGKYYVKRISYDERQIRVADVNLYNGSCSLPYASFSRDFMVPFVGDDHQRYYIFGNQIFTLDNKYLNAYFVNCSRKLVDRAYIKVPGLSGNHSNVYVNYHASLVSDFPESCSFVSLVPVLNGTVKNQNLSYEALRKLLESGFDLIWSVECRNCFAAGRLCVSSKDRAGNFEECSNSNQIRNFFFECYYAEGIGQKFICYQDKILFSFEILSASVTYVRLLLDGALVYLTLIRFILASILLVFLIHKYRTTLKRVDDIEKFLYKQQSWLPKRYSYHEIIAMTNHFKDKLGQGGFGSVYKGQLHSGCFIAVKMLENTKFNAEEFINEVSTVGRIHHVNVVQLLGFCSEGSKRALVYEYMPNGSLDRHIFSKDQGRGQSFRWEKLHEIALGAARGIEYLHGGCDVCILHFDIKPHNILLDHNFIPKVSDFGLAKFYPKENDFVSISATRGTIGYIAPELISRNFGTVSCKSDVYSFGMVLLEMAGGRRNSNMNATRSSKAYFPSWVYDQINKGRDLELLNVTEIESMIARKLCMIGLWCIQVKAACRPSMTKVLEMLEGSIKDMQMPPKPFFSSSSSSSSQRMSISEIGSDASTEMIVSQSTEDCSFNDSFVKFCQCQV